MDQLALLFVLLLGAVISVPVGDRFKVPAPVLMTLLGIVLALLPFVPNVEIAPDLILPLLLPPLLYAAVRRTSWRQFAANKRPIFLLAVALVFVTMACVAAVADAIVPGLPLAAACDGAPPHRRMNRQSPGRSGLPRQGRSVPGRDL
ncbi:cation:proton antiporter, partial [Streptomyces sp. NPDC006265]|uniref:cation:proton antiporter domain-containing protein n=1 Tax=Streptomyces sp. NPDC006265 TaxID=3156740 RepID=UPI0033B6604E